MKKHIFLLSLISLTFVTMNCSANDDYNSEEKNEIIKPDQYFHPPVWIQHNWGISNETSSNELYKITANDFIITTSDGSKKSITETIKTIPYGGSIEEILNNSAQYNFLIKYNNPNTIESFEFRKISETHIKCKRSIDGPWFDLVKL